MNLSQLKYIVSVEKERNFGRAARLCHVTQPTLSKEVQKLEKHLNTVIFDRTRHPVIPTAAGTKLIAQAQRVLQEFDHFKQLAQTDSELQGDCWLGVCPSMAPYLLPLFLPAFGKAHPQLKIHIKEMESEELLKALNQDELDAVLLSKPNLDNSFYQLDIGREPYVAYISEAHDLFNQKELDASALSCQHFYLPKEIAEHFDHDPELKSYSTAFNQASNLILDSGSLETLRRFVEMGNGITLIPQLATLYMGERRLRYIRPISEPVPSRKVVLASHRGFHKMEMLNHLKKAIKTAFTNGLEQVSYSSMA